ncbi:MAG: manganese/zinc/iron transport system permease protein [Flavobacteriaceae bacterium]|jgi:manganese/zinc/iron transport system permease protein
MYEIAKDHTNIDHPHAIKILNNFHGFTVKTLKQLETKEFILISGQNWSLTQKGYRQATTMFIQNEIENDNTAN